MPDHTLSMLFIVLGYAVGVMAVGTAAYYFTHSISDFVLGGRRLPAPVVALGACASDMSSWLTLALPALAFSIGVKAIWLPLGLLIGNYYNWLRVAKRLRIFTEILDDALTIPDYLVRRFEDGKGILRSLTSAIIILFFCFYASSGFVAAALLIQSLFGNDYSTGLYIITAVFVVYTCFGGFLGISWVDFIQGVLVFLFLLALPCFAIYHLGGFAATHHAITAHNPQTLKLFTDWTWLPVISFLVWGLGYMGQPHILVRFMAIDKAKHIPAARRIAITWVVVAMIGTVAAGIIGNGFVKGAHHFNDQLILVELSRLLTDWKVVGFVVAIMLSVAMSAIAAQLLVASSAMVEDIYRVYCRPAAKKKELLWVTRLAIAIIALLAMYLAHNPKSQILALVAYAWSGLGAAFGPVILFSLRWSSMTRAGAIAGILSGAATVIIWVSLRHAFGGVFALNELLPGFIVSSIAIYLVSLASRPLSAHMQVNFAKMLGQLECQ